MHHSDIASSFTYVSDLPDNADTDREVHRTLLEMRYPLFATVGTLYHFTVDGVTVEAVADEVAPKPTDRLEVVAVDGVPTFKPLPRTVADAISPDGVMPWSLCFGGYVPMVAMVDGDEVCPDCINADPHWYEDAVALYTVGVDVDGARCAHCGDVFGTLWTDAEDIAETDALIERL